VLAGGRLHACSVSPRRNGGKETGWAHVLLDLLNENPGPVQLSKCVPYIASVSSSAPYFSGRYCVILLLQWQGTHFVLVFIIGILVTGVVQTRKRRLCYRLLLPPPPSRFQRTPERAQPQVLSSTCTCILLLRSVHQSCLLRPSGRKANIRRRSDVSRSCA